METLDSLYADARKAGRTQAIKQNEAPADPGGLYRNPDNWRKGKGIALVHEETQTLLGNFTEYTHKSVVDARKLVREDSPISSVEYVKGPWLLPEPTLAPKRPWHQTMETVCDLRLFKMYAPRAELRAHFGEGRLVGLELKNLTVFASDVGDTVALITLPAGTEVLLQMSEVAIQQVLNTINQGTI